MIAIPRGVQVWLATGHTDMRKGFDGPAVLVQEVLKRDPHKGHLFVFRGRRGGLIKGLWHDGQGIHCRGITSTVSVMSSRLEARTPAKGRCVNIIPIIGSAEAAIQPPRGLHRMRTAIPPRLRS